MHFKNGREAKTGDHVITKSYLGNIVGGVVFDLNSNETCNASVAIVTPGGTQILTCQTVRDMYHVEDALAAISPKVEAPAAEAGTDAATVTAGTGTAAATVLAFLLCLFALVQPARADVTSEAVTNNVSSNALPPLPQFAIPGINLDFLTNLPMKTDFTQMTFGLETGAATENAQVANYIKGDAYFHTNWMISGEIQNAPVSTIIKNATAYGGWRRAWVNAEIYGQIGVRRTFGYDGTTSAAVPPSWQLGVLVGASWFPMTGGHVALTASGALQTAPMINSFSQGFKQPPNAEVRAGVKCGL